MNVCCFLLLFDFLSLTSAEIFTAISDVEPLLETHKRILVDLDDYISTEEKRLNILKTQLNLYRREHYKAMEDVPNYLGNPINVFTLIKRLTTDLDFIKENISKGLENKETASMYHEDVKYPVLEDLVGTAQALIRLQKTYRLPTEEFAEGILNGISYSYPMTTGDCFELGRVLFLEKEFENSLEWMQVAYKKISAESHNLNSISKVEILDYIRQSLYNIGHLKEAVVWSEILLTLDPDHVQANHDILRYKEAIANETNKNLEEERTEKVRGNEDVYESLCRGEMVIANEVTAKLKCRYVTDTHAFLRYAPIKVEEMYKDPNILVFHDVISNSEIELVQSMAKPRFKRAMVRDVETGKDIPYNYRISKSAWLGDNDSPVVARISRRVADMTGLSVAYAESLQVANYGIGGYYAAHYDFSRMSDVTQGGATVFPELGLTLYPQKGSAAFWLNLHPSGEGDLATKHAACPVLLGSKWVCNKWLHQTGQELIKPCTLEYQDEAIIHDIPRFIPKESKL